MLGAGSLRRGHGDLVSPFLEPVYQVLMQALQKYRTRSRLVLFDMLGVIAEYIGLEIGGIPCLEYASCLFNSSGTIS